jgi:phosphatidylglycerol:prolipoprotein diacylglycerol transferase
MLPTLSFGSLAIPTYPLFLLVSFWLGLWLAARQASKLGLDGDHIYNAGLLGLVAAIIGARVWFVLSHWENYAPSLLQALSLSRAALSVTEGLVIAGIVVLIYLQRSRVSLALFADAVAPGMALAVAVAQAGAFIAGVGLGRETNVPWAVVVGGTTRHPVQLYGAVTTLVIFGLLLALRDRPWPGFRFWVLVLLYATSRLFLEIFNAQPQLVGDGYLAGQILALSAVLVALAVMGYNFSQTHSRGSESQ